MNLSLPRLVETATWLAGKTGTRCRDCGELDELAPAYATTVHKAQGAEYPAVVIPVVTQHWSMPRRNLVYTAVTRGKRLVVVVGQPKAPAIAVRGTKGRRRWSKLSDWLREGGVLVSHCESATA